MVTIPPRDDKEEEKEEEKGERERGMRWMGMMGGREPATSVDKGEAGGGPSPGCGVGPCFFCGSVLLLFCFL